jgi:hypothetical protein
VIIATGAHWTAASALPAALAEDQRYGLAFYGYPAEHWGSYCNGPVWALAGRTPLTGLRPLRTK